MWRRCGAGLALLAWLCAQPRVSATISVGLGSRSNNINWILQNKNGSLGDISAVVPGGVYSDLMRAGVISDVLAGDAADLCRWVAYTTWSYSVAFNVTEEQMRSRLALLVLRGVDTASAVELNDNLVGRTDNMFLRYSFPIKFHLKLGTNLLKITLTPAPLAASRRSGEHYAAPSCPARPLGGECHVNQLRKMQISFGWEMAPALPSVGIWKPVHLEFTDSPIIQDATISMEEINDFWIIYMNVTVDARMQAMVYVGGYLQAQLKTNEEELTTVGRNVSGLCAADGTMTIDLNMTVPSNQVNLWWPNGLGNQPLYKLAITYVNHELVDTSSKTFKIGFRRIELIEDDAAKFLPTNASGVNGMVFHISVNGIPTFMKGANWIPAHILPEMTEHRVTIDNLLRSVVESHMTMLRVWGGGIYESDYFYSKCDQLGILVWQDFMFTNSMYPTDIEFLSSVETEVSQNVKRLQHHTCIALWGGNDENEVALRDNWYETNASFAAYKKQYLTLYIDTVKRMVEEIDPSRTFVVSSPSNGIKSTKKEGYISAEPMSSTHGDVHNTNLADPWSINMYWKTRFISKYGMQSYPSLATLRTATRSRKDLTWGSSFLKNRQHVIGGDDLIEEIAKLYFVWIKDKGESYMKKIIFYSQIAQALTLKAVTEYYRQNRMDWFTMGTLLWHLNDVWQAPSFSTIEYGGRWKMAQYFARDFFAPVLVSPRLLKSGDINVYIINDRRTAVANATLKVEVLKFDSFEPLLTDHYRVSVGPMEVVQAPLTINGLDINNKPCIFFRFELRTQEGKMISPVNYVFPKPFKYVPNLQEPQIKIVEVTKEFSTAERGGGGAESRFRVSFTSESVVLFLWLEAGGVAGRFADNGLVVTRQLTHVDFLAGESLEPARLRAAITFTYYYHPFNETLPLPRTSTKN